MASEDDKQADDAKAKRRREELFGGPGTFPGAEEPAGAQPLGKRRDGLPAYFGDGEHGGCDIGNGPGPREAGATRGARRYGRRQPR